MARLDGYQWNSGDHERIGMNSFCRWLTGLSLGLQFGVSGSTYLVELERPPVADVELARNVATSSVVAPGQEPGSLRRAEVLADQAALEPAITGLGGQVTGRFQTVLNAFRVELPAASLSAVRALPGVKQVRLAHIYQRQLRFSVPFIGAPAVWASSGLSLTGKGVKLGIIDSGIDYNHADFGGSGSVADYIANDPTLIEPGTFPTAKVVGGTDFVGEDYDASGITGSTTPVPDPDPLDDTDEHHGTHVAGIAAGFGVTTNHLTFQRGYSSPYNSSQFLIGPGVAPEASLYALKIFGKSGSTGAVPDALDWAADPNQDGRTADHLDVVNLSLGSEFGVEDPTDPELAAIDRLARLGCVVCIAAGNDGNTSYIVSSPGLAARAITVANSYADGNPTLQINVTAPAAVVGSYSAVEGDFTAPLSQVGTLSGTVVATSPADACATLVNGSALAGKIALINRGTCFFSEKVRSAQQSGAIAVIMVNNTSTPPFVMSGSGDTSDITIPGVMISQTDGAKLRAQSSHGLKVTIGPNVVALHPEYKDELDDSSSRGPVLNSSHLKPDIAAPGAVIHSALGGSGTDGITYSGTSMATPHVAGAAALLKQQHPTWSADDIKAALMNTSVPTRDASGNVYPESRTGAGRLKVNAAAATTVIFKADNSAGDISVNYGSHELPVAYSNTRNLRLVNHGSADSTFSLSSVATYAEPGIRLTFSPPSVTVPAGGSAVVAVRLDADPSQFIRKAEPTSSLTLNSIPRPQLPESSGEIWATNAALALHIPWYGIFRAASTYAVGATTVGLPTTDGAALFLPTRGTSSHSAPLAAVLELGAILPSHGFTDDQAETDVLAFGATSDFDVTRSVAAARLYFGFAVAGTWPTPQRAWINLDVEIDVNNDGVVDYTLVNGDAGTFASGFVDDYFNSTGALETIVRNESLASGNLTEALPINGLSENSHDTAPFENGTIIHGVRASAIGLTSAKSTFRYRIHAQGSYESITDWVDFDAARPVLDPTTAGINHTPFFAEGFSPQVAVHRSRADARGYGDANPLHALILHQHNPAGRRYDVVKLDLSTQDTDNDGLPDAWELMWFGDLTQSGNDDTSGDGVTNAGEYQRGRDPLVPVIQASHAPLNPVSWSSWPGYFYTLERSLNLANGFTIVRSHVPATGTNTSVSLIDNVVLTHAFYRVRRE